MDKYRKRIADALLAEKLSYMGAVLVQGAKWCGKTTTSEQLAKSVFYMGDPEYHEENLTLAKMKKPSFKMVLTAHGDFAYPYKDTDVLICPIGCLQGSGLPS